MGEMKGSVIYSGERLVNTVPRGHRENKEHKKIPEGQDALLTSSGGLKELPGYFLLLTVQRGGKR